MTNFFSCSFMIIKTEQGHCVMNHEFQRRANYDIGQISYFGYFSKVPFLESNIKSNTLKNKSFMEISNHTHL